MMACIINWNRRQLKGSLDLQEFEETEKHLIREIHVCFNFLSEVPATTFHHLSSLTYLSLSCNNLTTIPSLDCKHVPSLRELHLPSNHIARIENLEGLPALECLDLRCNQIQCIEGLARNTKLKRLTVSGNRITTVKWKDLPSFLPDLTFLGVYSNQLSTFEDVCKLLSLAPNLREASVGCNLFSEGQSLSLRSVLLGMIHVEAEQVREFWTQLRSCGHLDSSALESTCAGYTKGFAGAQRLSRVVEMLAGMKRACSSLVCVDGEELFCAI